MLLLSCAILLAAATSTLADDVKPDAGYELLFNGKDFTGWKQKGSKDSLAGKTEAFNGRFIVAARDARILIVSVLRWRTTSQNNGKTRDCGAVVVALYYGVVRQSRKRRVGILAIDAARVKRPGFAATAITLPLPAA